MPDNWYQLPDGTGVNIPDDTTPVQLGNLFDQLSKEFPDSIGRAWSVYGQGGREEEDKGNIFGALYQAIENIPRGAIEAPILDVQGIAFAATPHKDTELEKRLRGVRGWLESGVDPKYKYSKIAGIGRGIGQFIPMILAGEYLAAKGFAKGVPALLRKAGLRPEIAQMGQHMAGASTISVPMHFGDAANRVASYEERTGEDVSALRELAVLPGAALMGLLEVAPVYTMGASAGFFGAAARTRAVLGGASGATAGLAKSFMAGATTEAVQEAASEFGQMAIARALYDKDALANMGSDIWDAGIVGGGAGGVVSVLMNLASGAAGRRAFAVDYAAEDLVQQEDQRRKGRYREKQGVLETEEGPELDSGFFADPSISEEERTKRYQNRVGHHLDVLINQERQRAEQTGQEPITFTTERGSVYELLPDQTTVRQRVVDDDTGLVDPRREAQPPSQKTFFVTPEDAQRFTLFNTASPIAYVLAEMPGIPGKVGIKVASGESAGQWVPGATHPNELNYRDWLTQNGLDPSEENAQAYFEEALVPYGSTPEVGLRPVESWVDLSLPAEQLAADAQRRRQKGGYGNTAHFGNVITEVVGVEPFVPQTEEQLNAEAERRTQEDITRDIGLWQKTQDAAVEERQDAGATYSELDQLSDRSIEDIAELFRTGDISPEVFADILLADRLSTLGGDSRNELRDFAVRNAETNNRYNTGAIAAAIIGGDPSIVIGNETTADLFGDGNQPIEQRFANATNMLAPLLPETGGLLLEREYLTPSEVNQVFNEASKVIKGFKKGDVDSVIYGFRGGASLYDRVQRTLQEQETQWRENDTGQLELRLADPREQEVAEFLQDSTAKEVWGKTETFKEKISELLDLKNILLHTDDRTGATLLKSDGFTAMVRAVTGQENLNNLDKWTEGQKRALFGHIANLPTFSRPTPLPDLTRPTYSPEQARNVLEILRAKRDVETRKGVPWVDVNKELIDTTNPLLLDNPIQARALIRHLEEAGYITVNKGHRGLKIYLNDNTRPDAVPPVEVETDPERQAVEEEARKETKVADQLASKIQTLKTALTGHFSHMGLQGLDYILSADLDPIYSGIVGSEGIIANSDNMAQSLAALDGPNSKLLINLSRIDPDGTRDIKDIIDDIEHEVFHAYDQKGYWFEHELNTMDSRAFDTVVPAAVSEEAHNQGFNFVQLAEKLYPHLNQHDLMSEARAMYMGALSRGQLPRSRTAGKVNTLKKKITSFLAGGIEAGRESGLQDVMSIYTQFKSGMIGRRGAPQPGRPRSLRLSRYADPKHIEQLKVAIAENNVEAQEQITKDILDEKVHLRRMSEVPELTWRDKLFNKVMMQEELDATKPGEIPEIGINASDSAINEYFRQKRGEAPYTMPEAIKHKFRNQQNWAPSKDLEELMEQYAPETAVEKELTSEVYIDAMMELSDPVDQSIDDQKEWEGLTEEQKTLKKLKITRAGYGSIANAWRDPWRTITDKAYRKKNLWDYLRRRAADGAYRVELQEQLRTKVEGGIRRLADTSAIAMIRFRNNAMNAMRSVERLGGIRWIGDPLNGSHQFITYDEDTLTLDQMFGLLQTAHDRKWATRMMTAQRFLDYDGGIAQAQRFLDQAIQENNVANTTFFRQQVKDRKFRFGDKDSKPLDRESAEALVAKIKRDAPHVAEFMDAYFNQNQTNLDWLVDTGHITREMREYLKDKAYVPLYRNIGMERAYPLGSTGRSEGWVEKTFKWGTLREADGSVFDHALESFSDVDSIDLVRNILYSQQAMIRDGFTNVGAMRVVRTAQELTEKGFGVQSIQVDEAGPDVIRIMVDGQEEFHKMADPLLANSTMMLGFSSTSAWLDVMGGIGQAQRWSIINFPGFIFRNFHKDADQRMVLYQGSEASFAAVLQSLEKATESNLLQRAREAGLISGGGGAYYRVSDLISGLGPLQRLVQSDTPLGKSLRAVGIGDIGAQRARVARRQRRYEEVLAEFKEGKIPFRNPLDYVAFISTAYSNMRDLGEVTARMSAHDITLGRTGNPAQAMLDGQEVMNYGRRGDHPVLNAIMSMIPFMSGQITGLDTLIRSHNGSPDAPGAHLVNPLMNDETAKEIRNRTFMRGLHMMGGFMIYWLLTHDEEYYERASEVDKMNNYLFRIGNKVIKLPTSFTVGALYKILPEIILRTMAEDDYGAAEVWSEGRDQLKRNLGFHIAPQALRPIWSAMRNENELTREPIVPWYMEDMPSEYQRTEYTSNLAARLSKIVGVLPGDNVFSSPMKMEYLIRQYFGYAGMYSMLVTDRITREFTGQNMVGTRYDWAPSSLLTGEGIENFPVISEFVNDWRMGRGQVDKYYGLKEEVDIYVSIINKLSKEGSYEEVRKFMEDNVDTGNWRRKVSAYGAYMDRWRKRRDRLFASDWLTDEQKREILFEMIEERDQVLDGITDVKAGMKGLAAYNWERTMV